MRVSTVTLAFITLTAVYAAAAGLDGRFVEITTGNEPGPAVPITLDYAGPAPDGAITLDGGPVGRPFPATLEGGKLTFVAYGLAPNKKQTYTVRVGKKDPARTPRVALNKRYNEDVIDVYIDGQFVTAYRYSKTLRKPFLYPINSAGGVPVTRDWPIVAERGVEGKDHPHHTSLYSAYGEVNDANLWHESDSAGWQTPMKVTYGSGDAYGWIRSHNQWQTAGRENVVTEDREYRFYTTPEDGRFIDAKVVFTADHGDVDFHDTKEGGILSVRMRTELAYGNAHISNAHGDKGEGKVWGKPSAWCDYSGELPGIGWRGITIFDHPGNLRHPTAWHVRKYGLMAANCFGYSYFIKDDDNKDLMPSDNGDYKLRAGDSLAFNYRVYIHTGDVDTGGVAQAYAGYATPPKAAWGGQGRR